MKAPFMPDARFTFFGRSDDSE